MGYINPVRKEMTYEEALQGVLDVMSADIHYDESLDYQLTSDDLDWLDKAAEAIKKQIPKPPRVGGEVVEAGCKFHRFLCPVCDHVVGMDDLYDDYCFSCGQKLDWCEHDGEDIKL